MSKLTEAVRQVIAGNTDNAFRHRLQGTDEDDMIAARYDRQSAELQAELDGAMESMDNEGGGQ